MLAAIACSAAIAGDADGKQPAKSDDAAASASTQIECKARKRTRETWPETNRTRIDQEVAQHNLANGGWSDSMGPPMFVKRGQEAAVARNVARALSQDCAMKAADAGDAKASSEQKAPKAKRAGPR